MSYPVPAFPRPSAGAWFSLALLAAAPALPPLGAQPQVSIESQLVEIDTYFKQGQAAQAAGILDRIVARLDAGEALPAGFTAAQLRLAAATAHFQSRNFPRAGELAASVAKAPGATTQSAAEAAMIHGLTLAIDKKFAEALPVFKSAAAYAPLRDRALLYASRAAYQSGLLDEAIAGYNRLLEGALRDADWADAALSLIAIHVERGNLADAKRGLALLRGNLHLVDNLAGLNILYLQLGDALLQAKDYDGALLAYRTISPRADLLAEQEARNAALDAALARIKALPRPGPVDQDNLFRIENRREQALSAYNQIKSMADYDGLVRYRLGLSFQERGGTWQAALIYEDLLKSRPEALTYFNLVRAYADSGRFDRVRGATERFLVAFPESEHLPKAMFLAALAAGRTQDSSAQLRFLDQAVASATTPDLKQTMLLMRANALFTLARYAEAGETNRQALAEFPAGRYTEEHTYLVAMAELNQGNSSRAEPLLQAYILKYPKGQFAADARYRLAATAYSRQDYDTSLLVSTAWLEDFPSDHYQRGEVLSLQGDAYAGRREIDAALASYRAALAINLPDELLGYVLDEITRLHQSRQEYDAAVEVWTEFTRNQPDHPFVINAAYWIGRLRSREGRFDEALDAQGRILRRYVSEPRFDNVERLLIEFASLLARPPARKRGEPKPPELPLPELFERAELLLVNNRTAQSPTTRARVLFVQAEIASLRSDVVLSRDLYGKIAAQFTPDTLPPGVLGKVGDYLLSVNQLELASSFFNEITAKHAKSIFADFGYHGLGQIALRQGKPAEALSFFDIAVDKAGARFKLKEITLGRGHALIALDRLDEAQQVFENIASNRAWRGDATAESLIALGDIALKRGNPDSVAQAQAHYQRVYLGYKRFITWVAVAYTRSAEAFVALNQRDEAITTLQRMLTDQRLANLPENDAAQSRLRELIAERDSGRPSTPRLGS